MCVPLVRLRPGIDRKPLGFLPVAVREGAGSSAITACGCSYWHRAQYPPYVSQTAHSPGYARLGPAADGAVAARGQGCGADGCGRGDMRTSVRVTSRPSCPQSRCAAGSPCLCGGGACWGLRGGAGARRPIAAGRRDDLELLAGLGEPVGEPGPLPRPGGSRRRTPYSVSVPRRSDSTSGAMPSRSLNSANRAEEGLAQDQERPPLAEDAQRAGDRQRESGTLAMPPSIPLGWLYLFRMLGWKNQLRSQC